MVITMGTFSYTQDGRTIVGTKWMAWGTFSSDSETTGELYTGLELVENLQLTVKDSSVAANAPTYNETLPTVDPITIICDAGEDGCWIAIGRM